MDDTKQASMSLVATNKVNVATLVDKHDNGRNFKIVIKGTDVFGNSHTLAFSEKGYAVDNDDFDFPISSIWIGPIHVLFGYVNMTSYYVNITPYDVEYIEELTSLFFHLSKPVDIKKLCRVDNGFGKCNPLDTEHVQHANEYNVCYSIYRNFKRYLGKQESAIVTRVQLNGVILHSVFEHDVKGKIHGLKTEYQCHFRRAASKQTKCNFYRHGKRVNKKQWKLYKQKLVICITNVTGIAKVLVKSILFEYLFNIPSIFPQQLNVKLDYELSIPTFIYNQQDTFRMEPIDFRFAQPFQKNYYTCSKSHKIICKCNVCKTHPSV